MAYTLSLSRGLIHGRYGGQFKASGSVPSLAELRPA
jgi:hypothetical protein